MIDNTYLVFAEGCRGEEVARTFLEIWKSRPPRLVVPLLRTADVLLPQSAVKGRCPLAEEHSGWESPHLPLLVSYSLYACHGVFSLLAFDLCFIVATHK